MTDFPDEPVLPDGIVPADLDDFDVDDTDRDATAFATLDDLMAGEDLDFARPVDWIALSAAEWRAEMNRLRPFVARLLVSWPLSGKYVPLCWEEHEAVVWTLAQVRDSYLTAFHPSQPASASAEWGMVWSRAQSELLRIGEIIGCGPAGNHRDERPASWAVEMVRQGEASSTWQEAAAAVDRRYAVRVQEEAARAMRAVQEGDRD